MQKTIFKESLKMTDKLYLNNTQLKAELERCLKCANKPCTKACPVHCSPQEFISQAKEGNFNQAVSTISSQNPMGQTCGLICPDKFCMQACTRNKIDFAINIPKVQATIMKKYRTEEKQPPFSKSNGFKIAIIGAGPAGLSAAKSLCQKGFEVCIYEAEGKIGGALSLIPEDRLPYEVIEKDAAEILKNELITLHLNSRIANPSDLFNQSFDGVIIAGGEQKITALNITGQEYSLPYTEYLKNPEKYKTAGKVAIIGGGNVAIDCALTARKNGAMIVEMFVRRRLSNMRISKQEYLEIINQEINVNTLSSPKKIEKETDGQLCLYVCKNQYNNNLLEEIPNSTAKLEGFDFVVTAIGRRAEPKIDDSRIIYAGDCLTGGSTLVQALASGREAAELMADRLLQNKK